MIIRSNKEQRLARPTLLAYNYKLVHEVCMRHVLVIQLARFGDIVQSKRLLLSLAADDSTRVHFCVDATLAPLAKKLYPFVELHTLRAHSSTAAEVFSVAAETFAAFEKAQFERIYLLNYSPLSFALASLFEAEQVFGYARIHGQPMRGPWALITFNLMHDRRFAPLNLVDLWAHLHSKPLGPEKVNPIPRSPGSQRIGIVMAGRESRRSLPPAVLATCVQAVFQARGGPELVCIGSSNERPLVRRLARELSGPAAGKIEDRTGQTTLTDLPDLMRELDMVITPDTGAMHLAAHLGVPVQAFFLSSAWCFETGPYGFGHKIWQSIEPCSPCHESTPCPRRLECLTPFSDRGFLAHLGGKYSPGWPEGLLGCASSLDELGAVCKVVDGEDMYADGRRELRNGLKEYLRLTVSDAAPPFMSQDLAEYLYREKDWMLPPNWR